MKSFSKHHGWTYPQRKMKWDSSIFDAETDDPVDGESPDCKVSTVDDRHQERSTSKSSQSDYRKSDDDVKLVYCCHVCSFSSSSSFHYRLHLAEHTPHPAAASVQTARQDPAHPRCRQCGYLADGDLDSRRHEKNHAKEKRYVCIICNNSYASFTRTLEHFRYRHAGVTEGRHILDRKVLHRSLAKRVQKIVFLDARVVLKVGEVGEKLGRRREESEEKRVPTDSSTSGRFVHEEVKESEFVPRPDRARHCLNPKPYSMSSRKGDKIQDCSRPSLKTSYSIERVQHCVDKRSKRDRSPGNP